MVIVRRCFFRDATRKEQTMADKKGTRNRTTVVIDSRGFTRLHTSCRISVISAANRLLLSRARTRLLK